MIGTTLVDMDSFSLVTYDGTELGSTGGTADEKFDVLLLVASLGSIYGLQVGYTEGTELWVYNGIVIGTTLGTYDGKYLGLSQCSSTSNWKFEVAVDGLELGTK